MFKVSRNIKIREIIVWSGVCIYLFVSLSFISRAKKDYVCSEINVIITDSSLNNFISKEEVKELVLREDLKILGYPVSGINTKLLEDVIIQHPPIRKVEVYVQIDGILNIEVTQRKPILRIVDKRHRSYYIDSEGYMMPLSPKYASHVLVANGNIDDKIMIRNGICITDSSDLKAYHAGSYILQELYLLAKAISSDIFLSAQVEQVFVNSRLEYELIPRVGENLIKMGDISNYQYKLKKLKAFYSKGLNNIGWDQYSDISLQYSNQVICKKINSHEKSH
jgi:cell division protein FtsQ